MVPSMKPPTAVDTRSQTASSQPPVSELVAVLVSVLMLPKPPTLSRRLPVRAAKYRYSHNRQSTGARSSRSIRPLPPLASGERKPPDKVRIRGLGPPLAASLSVRQRTAHGVDLAPRRKPMSEPYLAIQVIMMPRDTNPRGTIFGGVLLSYIDQAGAIGAAREVLLRGGTRPFLVTVAVNRVEFKQPVLVGDVVRFLTTPARFGRTSVTVRVRVEAQRGVEVLHVTEAELVYVGV